MPKILGREEQEQALKDIRALLKGMKGVNSFLEAVNPDGVYQVSMIDSAGTRFAADIYAENKADINRLVLDHKRRVRDHIYNLAKENRIALDPEDEELLRIEEARQAE